MNPILEKIIDDRKGQYVHALEVEDVYELESVVEQIVDEFHGPFNGQEIADFLSSMQIYYLGEDEEMEKEVYNFNVEECVFNIVM